MPAPLSHAAPSAAPGDAPAAEADADADAAKESGRLYDVLAAAGELGKDATYLGIIGSKAQRRVRAGVPEPRFRGGRGHFMSLSDLMRSLVSGGRTGARARAARVVRERAREAGPEHHGRFARAPEVRRA